MRNDTKNSLQTPQAVKHPFTQPPYAFPVHAAVQTPSGVAHITSAGMTLRDYFAGQALAGMMANERTNGGTIHSGQQDMANVAYRVASAMLRAREEQ